MAFIQNPFFLKTIKTCMRNYQLLIPERIPYRKKLGELSYNNNKNTECVT